MTINDFIVIALLVLTMGMWLEWRINKMMKITYQMIKKIKRIENFLNAGYGYE